MEQTINILINFLFYVSIPLIIRYIILRRPLNNKWIAFVILIPVFIGFSMLISEQKKQFYQESGVNYKPRMIGSPLLYSSMIGSYFILCGSFRRKREADKKNNSDNDDADKLTNNVIHKNPSYNEISSSTTLITGSAELKSVPVPQAKSVSQKTHEVDSYFENGNINKLYTDDYLEKNWNIALKYCKDLQDIDYRLSKISESLSYKFRAYLLKEKLFDQRQKIADAMEHKFFKDYFGENQKIVEFARYLLLNINNRVAAKSLNEAVKIFGDKINCNEIIEQIKDEFGIVLPENGLRVIVVEKQSQAEIIGIKEEDIIFSYNNESIRSNDELTSIINASKYNMFNANNRGVLKVMRGQKQVEFNISTKIPLGIVTKQISLASCLFGIKN